MLRTDAVGHILYLVHDVDLCPGGDQHEHDLRVSSESGRMQRGPSGLKQGNSKRDNEMAG